MKVFARSRVNHTVHVIHYLCIFVQGPIMDYPLSDPVVGGAHFSSKYQRGSLHGDVVSEAAHAR